MLTRKKILQAGAAALVSLGMAVSANAATVYLPTAPANEASTVDTMKALAKNETAWKCEEVEPGPSINPVKVPGTTATWHLVKTFTGTLENPFVHLAEAKPTWRCKTMKGDMKTGRVRTAR